MRKFQESTIPSVYWPCFICFGKNNYRAFWPIFSDNGKWTFQVKTRRMWGTKQCWNFIRSRKIFWECIALWFVHAARGALGSLDPLLLSCSLSSCRCDTRGFQALILKCFKVNKNLFVSITINYIVTSPWCRNETCPACNDEIWRDFSFYRNCTRVEKFSRTHLSTINLVPSCHKWTLNDWKTWFRNQFWEKSNHCIKTEV